MLTFGRSYFIPYVRSRAGEDRVFEPASTLYRWLGARPQIAGDLTD